MTPAEPTEPVEAELPPLTPYDAWKLDPSPKNMHAVVGSLKPVLDYQLASLGSGDDPLLRNQARVLAAAAVKKYDPSYGAALPTWVSNSMMELRRFRRQSRAILKVPERMQLDNFHLAQKEQEFIDKHDREPDLIELADYSKIPARRIAKIRAATRTMPTEAGIGDTSNVEPDYSDEATDYVYRDADHIDRRILELKTGLGGHAVMSPVQIAQKLKISTAQVSRRAARLALKINQVSQDLTDL